MIREAVEDDAGVLAELYWELMGTPTDPRALALRLRALSGDSRFRVLVAEDAGGHVVGTAYVVLAPNVVGEGRPFVVMDNLIVTPAARGQGIATALMEAVESFAEGAQASLIMMVSGAARAEAHRLYRRLGYRVPVVGFKKYLDARATRPTYGS